MTWGEKFGHRHQRVSVPWGNRETSHPCYQSWASPCNRSSPNPSEDNTATNWIMHAMEDEVRWWFPGGRRVTEKPASCWGFIQLWGKSLRTVAEKEGASRAGHRCLMWPWSASWWLKVRSDLRPALWKLSSCYDREQASTFLWTSFHIHNYNLLSSCCHNNNSPIFRWDSMAQWANLISQDDMITSGRTGLKTRLSESELVPLPTTP